MVFGRISVSRAVVVITATGLCAYTFYCELYTYDIINNVCDRVRETTNRSIKIGERNDDDNIIIVPRRLGEELFGGAAVAFRSIKYSTVNRGRS